MDLANRWAQLKSEQPRLRALDAAKALGVSEGELIASRVGAGATRLRPDWKALLAALPKLGRVMALTRNEQIVHERKGTYSLGSVHHGKVGLVVGADIDLRLFLDHWHHAFAMPVDNPRGTLRSLQVYDADGSAVHKIYSTGEADDAAWDALIAELASDDQSPGIATQALKAPPTDPADDTVDVTAFREAWAALTDTHDFFPLLRRFKLGRQQALRLGGEAFARPVELDSFARVLRLASDREVPIMVFVGNPGCIQIHTGPVKQIVPMRGWLNVLDPDFNLHVKEDGLATAWWVRKPTDDGDVHSLEVFDGEGTLLVQLFGKRKPGIPEDPAWRELLSDAALPNG